MPTVGQLRSWQPAQLAESSRRLGAARTTLVGLDGSLTRSATVPGWTGDAATEADRTARSLREQLDEIVAGVAAGQRALGEAADDVTHLQQMLAGIEQDAAGAGLTLADDGTVTSAPIPPGTPAQVAAATQQVTAARDATAARLQQLLRTADDIDAKTAHVLDALASGTTPQLTDTAPTGLAASAAAGQASGGITAPTVPPDATAAQNLAWWASLTAPEQQAITRDRPDIVGGLDGMPAATRDQANRTVLAQQKADLQRQRTDLMAGGAAPDDSRLADVNDRLAGIAAIEDRLAHPPPGQPAALLLGLDATSTGSGRAVIAVGNPDTAANVATYVPGFRTRLGGGTGGDIGRVDQTVTAASRLTAKPSAGILWLGYDAPQGPDVATAGDAERAAPDLDRFQDGLRIAHQGPVPAHDTVIGHSYGSVVTGAAAQLPDGGLHADDIVIVGSPGTTADHAAQLGVTPDHVWTSTAQNDPIHLAVDLADAPHGDQLYFGQDPDTPAFGGHHFTSDPGVLSHAHSGYWDANNPALRNIGAVVAGTYDKVH